MSQSNLTRTLLVAGALALVGAPFAARAGSIRGTVTTKKAADTKVTEITNSTDVCGQKAPSRALLVKDGKVRNAVASVSSAKRQKTEKTERTLEQKGCRFEPHVIDANKGDELVITNQDKVLHNVHAKLDGKRTLFNLAMPIPGQRITKKLKGTGELALQCDAGHSWMKAYVLVFKHPFHDVSDEAGEFVIENLPAGKHTLEVWHETLGTKTIEVEVPAEGEATVEVEL